MLFSYLLDAELIFGFDIAFGKLRMSLDHYPWQSLENLGFTAQTLYCNPGDPGRSKLFKTSLAILGFLQLCSESITATGSP